MTTRKRPAPRAKARNRATVRRKTALGLRLQGLTFEAIAEKLGVTRQAAHAAVTSELDALAAESRADAEKLRDLELARLDAMLSALWPAIKRGSQGAVDKALKVCARRARLLGLDAPTEIKANVDGLAGFLASAFGTGSGHGRQEAPEPSGGPGSVGP